MFGWFRKQPKTESPLDADSRPPISLDDLRQLFEYLDRPNPPPCQHDHRETLEFLMGRGLPTEPTIEWLKANGGFCDCEVIFNVTDKWGEQAGWCPTDEE